MNKNINLAALALLVGIAIGQLSIHIQIVVIVFAAGMLWDRWDEYCVNGGGQA